MLLMLSAAPVLWKCHSGLKFRDSVVELSRWVLGPKCLSTVDHRHPLLTGEKGISLITTDAPARGRSFSHQEEQLFSLGGFRH